MVILSYIKYIWKIANIAIMLKKCYNIYVGDKKPSRDFVPSTLNP